VPPYLFFEFQKLLPGIFESGEQNPPVEVGLASVEDRGDLFHERCEHVGDNPKVLKPRAFGSFFQRFYLKSFLSCMEGLHKECRIADHVFPLSAGSLLVMAKEKGHLPGGEGCSTEALRECRSVLRYRARNGGDHPRGGPGRDRAFPDQLYDVSGQSVIEGQHRRDPALSAPHHGGDSFLGEVAAVMELRKEGRLFDHIPFSPMAPGEDLHEGLFLRAVPYLRHDRVAPEVAHGLHPQVAVEKDEGFCHDHGDDLAETLDGDSQGEALFGPLYPCMGVVEMKQAYFDLPDHDLTPGGGTGPPPYPRIRKNGT